MAVVIPKIMFLAKSQAQKDGLKRKPMLMEDMALDSSAGQSTTIIPALVAKNNAANKKALRGRSEITRFQIGLQKKKALMERNINHSVGSSISFDSAVTPDQKVRPKPLRATTIMNQSKNIAIA